MICNIINSVRSVSVRYRTYFARDVYWRSRINSVRSVSVRYRTHFARDVYWRSRKHLTANNPAKPLGEKFYPERYQECPEEVELSGRSAELEDNERSAELEDNVVYIKGFKAEGSKAKVGKDVIDALQSHFDLSINKASEFVNSPKLYMIPDAVILETIAFLKYLEISTELLLRSPWILFQSRGLISEKIQMLTGPYLFENYHDGFGFCQFTPYGIELFQNRFEQEKNSFPNHRNRLYYMSEKLEIPVDRLAYNSVKVRRLLTITPTRIELWVALLKKYKIQTMDIESDLWIFLHSLDMSERRLKAVVDAGCTRPKLWMCRCTKEVFAKSLARYQSDKDTLGECTTLEEYLTKRLNCDQEEVRKQLKNIYNYKKVNATRAAKTIDLLLDNGMTPAEIRNNLRILRYSRERTEQRLKRLKELGVVKIKPSVFYVTSKRFEIQCSILKKKLSSVENKTES